MRVGRRGLWKATLVGRHEWPADGVWMNETGIYQVTQNVSNQFSRQRRNEDSFKETNKKIPEEL